MNENTEVEELKFVTPDLLGWEILMRCWRENAWTVFKATVWAFSPNGKHVQIVSDTMAGWEHGRWLDPRKIRVLDVFPDRHAADDRQLQEIMRERPLAREKFAGALGILKWVITWGGGRVGGGAHHCRHNPGVQITQFKPTSLNINQKENRWMQR